MKYTTKSGKELPPEVVEVIEREQARQKEDGFQPSDKLTYTFGINWAKVSNVFDNVFDKIYHNDDFTEFYKLYPKKDLDSYGNEIVKGDKCDFTDNVKTFEMGYKGAEYIGMHKGKYIACSVEDDDIFGWTFCRKINTKETKKSELQSQMNDLLKQAKEIEAKINEL